MLSLVLLAFGFLSGTQIQPSHGKGLSANNLLVELPYASYEGFFNSTSSLNVWLGVRYAAAPVGDLRWAAPTAPPAISSSSERPTFQANTLPKQCPQNVVSLHIFSHQSLNVIHISRQTLRKVKMTRTVYSSMSMRRLMQIIYLSSFGYESLRSSYRAIS